METKSQEQANFRHLVFDVIWFGIALAATSRFLSVYAIRLGATPAQLGWIAALPGVMLMFSAGFSGWWRRRHRNSLHAVLGPTFVFRIVFLLPVFAPFMPEPMRPAWLILAVTLPALPQGLAGAMFVAMMRETVSQERQVALHSKRFMALNFTIAIGALLFGVLLEILPFPLNYQVMFVIAFIFAIISYLHVAKVKSLEEDIPAPPRLRMPEAALMLRSPGFVSVALLSLLTHVTFTMLSMVIPLRLVDEMGASEGYMALYGVVELGGGVLMAGLMERFLRRWSAPHIIALMMVGLAFSAGWMAIAPHLMLILFAAFLNGACWSAVVVALFSHLTAAAPEIDNTRSSAMFQQVTALGVFIGPLLGSMLIDLNFSVVNVLIAGALIRALAGFIAAQDIEVLLHPRRKRPAVLYALNRHSRRRRR